MGALSNDVPLTEQISAEQILFEAFNSKIKRLDNTFDRIADTDELAEFERNKRTEFEEALRRKKRDIRQWMRYAQFEYDHSHFGRARSVFERALLISPDSVALWLRYIQMELKSRNINHARNLFDRATNLLPRVDKIWQTYVETEELLGNFQHCEHVYEQWLQWLPPLNVWVGYAGFKVRCQTVDAARALWKRLVLLRPEPESWMSWAAFEKDYGTRDLVRGVYSAAVDQQLKTTGPLSEMLILEWAKWEFLQREVARARALLEYAAPRVSDAAKIYKELRKLEGQFGSAASSTSFVTAERENFYEEELRLSKGNKQDIWWSYLGLALENFSTGKTRTLFERAVGDCQPSGNTRIQWIGYHYIWLRFAIFEELYAEDTERCRQVYNRAVAALSDQTYFGFPDIWTAFAKFEIRQNNVNAARFILDDGLKLTKAPALYLRYVALEYQLQNYDRCRRLYESFIEMYPELSLAWENYALMEIKLNEQVRARGLFNIALSENFLDKPDKIWVAFANFEADFGNDDDVRNVYRRFMSNYPSYKAWAGLAMFELSNMLDEDDEPTDEGKIKARSIFSEGYDALMNYPKERALLYDAGLQFEEQYGDEGWLNKWQKKAPKIIVRRRVNEDGAIEEYEDYVYPDVSEKASRLLAKAKQWAQENCQNVHS